MTLKSQKMIYVIFSMVFSLKVAVSQNVLPLFYDEYNSFGPFIYCLKSLLWRGSSFEDISWQKNIYILTPLRHWHRWVFFMTPQSQSWFFHAFNSFSGDSQSVRRIMGNVAPLEQKNIKF